MRFSSRRSTVFAGNGMVATSQPLAAMAGLRTMMGGGNAVDAAVATAAALNVVEPPSTGVGGDLFALVWMSREKRVRALNASGRSAAAASIDELARLGHSVVPAESACAITVPGAVSGWQALVETYGSVSLSRALLPAIEYASEGFPVSDVISSMWAGGVEKLKAHPSGAELLPDGRAPLPGEVVRLPELADTLRTVAEGGAGGFYGGPIGERIAEYVQRQGGWLTVEDLTSQEASWVEPISTDYRGVQCWECPPNSQGVNTLMALNLAEGFDLESMGLQSPDTYHHLIECMRLAFADGVPRIADPDAVEVPVAEMLSKDRAAERRGLIRPNGAMQSVPQGLAAHHGDTVYVAAVDGEGNACSLINSIYDSFGSGLVVPGAGIALHNRGASFSLDPSHPNALAPRKRPFHTLVPGMATRDGELWLTYGVMGTMQQAQGHFQVLVNMIDFGLDPQAALDAPRFRTSLDEGTYVEDLAPDEVAPELRRRGYDVTIGTPNAIFFGGGQVIERSPDTGALRGGSEPRNDGFALGW